jgi:hypothetical protein
MHLCGKRELWVVGVGGDTACILIYWLLFTFACKFVSKWVMWASEGKETNSRKLTAEEGETEPYNQKNAKEMTYQLF